MKDKIWIVSIAIASVFFTEPVRAEMSYLKLKNLDSIFLPECPLPSQGFTAVKTEAFRNMRFLGNFGPKKDPFGCHRQVRPEQQSKNCPQDWPSAYIQMYFPTADGFNLVANQGSTDDPLSKLPLDAVGRNLSTVRKFNGSNLDEMTLALMEALYPQSVQQERLKTNKKKASSDEERESNLIRALETTKKWKELLPAAAISFHAVKDEQRERNNRGWIYPHDIVEQTLLAYAWKRAGKREDYLKLAQGIPECVKATEKPWVLADITKPIADPALDKRRQDWLAESYSVEQYKQWKTQFVNDAPTAQQIQDLAANPELLAFYAYGVDVIDSPLPPLVEGGEAAHKSLGKNTKNNRKYNLYPSCGEDALRDVFYILTYNKEKQIFDVSFLEQAQKVHDLKFYEIPGKKNEKGLLAFFRGRYETDPETKETILDLSNTDPTQVESNRVRDDWSRRVASALPAGNYLKGGGQCEINAGIKNIQAILGTLLGDPKWDEQKDAIAKWDRFCHVFSRDGFQLDWTVLGGTKQDLNKDIDITIAFSINGQTEFTWYFGGGHFSVQKRNQSKLWRSSVGKTVGNSLAEISRFKNSLPWFMSQSNINDIYQKYPEANLIWSLRLRGDFFRTFRFVFKHEVQSFYPLITRWIEMMPLTNIAIQRRLNGLYADFGYPLGDYSAHPGVYKSDEHYVPVTKAELEKEFGKNVADKLGRSVRNPFDRNQVLGDTIRTVTGADDKMDWQDGMAACLALNAEWNPAITETLDKINPEKNPNRYEELAKQVRHDLLKYGKACYAPETSMWREIRDFLTKDVYQPRDIPNLFPERKEDRYFLVGSSSFGSWYYLQSFNGLTGRIGDKSSYLPTEKYSVRCVCTTAAK